MDVTAEVVEELVERLEERGAPEGTWLVDIGAAREALRNADNTLRRLEDALIRKAAAR